MNKWQIKDLKGVGDVELNLDSNQRVFTFLGTNGVGKTKTLEALCLLILGEMYPDDLLYHIKSDIYEEKPFSEIFFNKKAIYLSSLNASKELIFGTGDFNTFAFITAKSRSSIDNTSNIIHMETATFDYRKKERIFWLMEMILNSKLSDIIGDTTHAWFLERAISVNPYQKEKNNKKADIDSVLNALNKLDDRIEKILSIDENGKVYLTIDGQERELSELSSGFLSLVKIIQSIIASFSAFTNEKDLLNVKGVVLIDEIESHLHLEWQVKIIPILKNLFPNTTFYITTHSPLVLSQLNEGEAYLLKRDDDNVVRSHLINSPNTRLLENVLQDAFGVNLNELKRQNMSNIDQSKAKKKLLDLLNSQVSQ